MNKIIPVILLIFCATVASGQHTKTVELKPIHVQGGRYYYDFKWVYGGAVAIQLPLLSLEDQEVDLRVKNYKTLKGIERVISLIPLIYFFTIANSNQYINQSTFWTVWGASVAGVLAFNIAASSQLKKGIDRYNLLIVQPSGASLGGSIIYKFGH